MHRPSVAPAHELIRVLRDVQAWPAVRLPCFGICPTHGRWWEATVYIVWLERPEGQILTFSRCQNKLFWHLAASPTGAKKIQRHIHAWRLEPHPHTPNSARKSSPRSPPCRFARFRLAELLPGGGQNSWLGPCDPHGFRPLHSPTSGVAYHCTLSGQADTKLCYSTSACQPPSRRGPELRSW